MKEFNVKYVYECVVEDDTLEGATEYAKKMLREKLIRAQDLEIEVTEK